MSRTSSLAFLTLDHHVVHGRADDVALSDADGDLTFAQLLDQVASVAGGLRILGLGDGDTLHLAVSGRPRALTVLAALRLQVVPGEGGAALSGDPVVASVGAEEVPWTALREIGRTDPLPAPAVDLDGVQAWRQQHGDVVDALLDGRPVQL
ncbi:hypothetical protein [Aeromicrobium sp.]|uniref:hypothetical protein n=1 Tax=Aeromicrobium sp. TaxID=1871063 RepID=UPI0025C4DA79|nr:hypothetical protein [Aeromicrobium sp.]MCK5890752.1 hypothetical protein [Aeromicrobium sp.]